MFNPIIERICLNMFKKMLKKIQNAKIHSKSIQILSLSKFERKRLRIFKDKKTFNFI
jgi:ribosomal protein S8